MIVKLGLNKLQQLTRNYPRINIHFSRKFFDSSNPIDKQKIFLTDKYNSFRFNQIILFTHKLKNSLLTELNVESLNGRRVAVLCANNYTYLLSILAIWLARGVPVILNKSYPVNSLEYFLVDSKSELVINSFDPIEDYNYFKQSRLPELDILTQRLNIKKLTLFEHRFFRRSENNQSIYLENQLGLDDLIYKIQFNETNESDALIVYTSGSSGPPKGVVLTYKNVYNFVHTLNDCWKLSSNDKLLNVLPLNHIHGLIYSLLAPFLVGAEVDLMSKFNPQIVWLKLLDETNGINILTAVPTVYTKLVQFYYENEDLRQFYSKNKIRDIIGRKMRIMASASAPLDIKTSKEWVNLTGFKLIERYGLSEAGMVLSNSIFDRNPLENTVGKPYGNVNVRVCDSQNSDEILVQSDAKSNQVLTSKKDKITGELQIKGPILFKEYLNKAEETKESFTNDGWFKTGDTVEFLTNEGCYRIIGRTSVDIIKCGGFKINALDVERVLITYPLIEEVAVMGINDPIWGERVFALIVLKKGTKEKREFNEKKFLEWCKDYLPKQNVPTVIKYIDSLPRNHMGKINKKELVKLYNIK